MLKLFLGIILFFLLLILLVGALGLGFLRSLFRTRKQKPQPTDKSQTHANSENRDKVFGENEGEYVEFEEIKEPDKEEKS